MRPVCDCRIKGRVPHRDRTRCGDDPANMVGVPVPQLDAEAHVGDVVQIGIGELAECSVYLAVEVGRRVPMQAAFSAQLFEQAKRMELAVVLGGLLTHGERKENISPWRVKRQVLDGSKILADKRGTERSCPFPATFFSWRVG